MLHAKTEAAFATVGMMVLPAADAGAPTLDAALRGIMAEQREFRAIVAEQRAALTQQRAALAESYMKNRTRGSRRSGASNRERRREGDWNGCMLVIKVHAR